MIEKAPRIEGRETKKYSFEYEGKELNYEIQEPTFDQLASSLSQIRSDGRTDMIGAGKVIWELCCVAHDAQIAKVDRILISICLNLAAEYALPVDIEIKKK